MKSSVQDFIDGSLRAEITRLLSTFPENQQALFARAHPDGIESKAETDLRAALALCHRTVSHNAILHPASPPPRPDANAGVLQEALTLGRDAVMESFDHVSDKADQDIADMRLRSIDAALAAVAGEPIVRSVSRDDTFDNYGADPFDEDLVDGKR